MIFIHGLRYTIKDIKQTYFYIFFTVITQNKKNLFEMTIDLNKIVDIKANEYQEQHNTAYGVLKNK